MTTTSDEIFPAGGGLAGQAAQAAPKKGTETAVPQDIFHQLQFIQQKLKVGKNNTNRQMNEAAREDSFPYRTLEDIYIELKPILAEAGCVLTASCRPVPVGQCIFAEATVTLENARGEKRQVTASAMMNLTCGTYKYPAQEALACETMARKSALGAMFLLDNTTREKQADMITREMDSLTQPGHKAVQTAAPAPERKAPAAQAPAPERKAATAPAAKAATPTAAAPAASAHPAPPAASGDAPARIMPAPAEGGKPKLVAGSAQYRQLGVNAASRFRGTKEQLIASLRQRYDVDDETAEAFTNSFLNAPAEAA